MRQAFRKCGFFFTEERAGAIESLVWKKHNDKYANTPGR